MSAPDFERAARAYFPAATGHPAAPLDARNFNLADLWPLDRPLGMAEVPTPYFAGDR